MDKEKINIDVEVNTEEIEKAKEKAEELEEILPKIVIKNNQNVYLTINHFTEKTEDKEV